MPLEPNVVYLLPPMKEMIIRDRRLLLSDKDPRHGLTLPIDIFFRSLAKDVGDHAIAVVLSGSGSDGSRGISKSAKPAAWSFARASRPRSSTACRGSAIAHRRGRSGSAAGGNRRGGCRARAAAACLASDSPAAHRRRAPARRDPRLLRDEYGIDFSHYKTTTVTRRIERRLALNRRSISTRTSTSCAAIRAS